MYFHYFQNEITDYSVFVANTHYRYCNQFG